MLARRSFLLGSAATLAAPLVPLAKSLAPAEPGILYRCISASELADGWFEPYGRGPAMTALEALRKFDAEFAAFGNAGMFTSSHPYKPGDIVRIDARA